MFDVKTRNVSSTKRMLQSKQLMVGTVCVTHYQYGYETVSYGFKIILRIEYNIFKNT